MKEEQHIIERKGDGHEEREGSKETRGIRGEQEWVDEQARGREGRSVWERVVTW